MNLAGLRALTFIQPWATAVALLLKKYETRSWAPSRGMIDRWVAIHAGKKIDRAYMYRRDVRDALPRLPTHILVPTGGIIAVARIVDLYTTDELVRRDMVSETEALFGDFSPGRFAWEFGDVRVLNNPVACKGMLGISQVPEHIIRKVEQEMQPQEVDSTLMVCTLSDLELEEMYEANQ